MNIDNDKFYTLKEAAEMLQLHVWTLRRKCKNWDIKSSNSWTKTRNIYWIRGESILNFLNK